MLQSAKNAVRAKAAALRARVVEAAGNALRAAALGLVAVPGPVPVPVPIRVRDRRPNRLG
ncbi:hypothetical protein SAMN05216360_112208 [Methylobacterium phyllostachyos]|uniref:Uncharacterized protein n=1 Tax=Methylobacterium phyllostachyos TaxID=582672 RepID=A0A1H0FD02_9HYPH|nr:hypothetical protein [Methylobacterium phyllostachyos]SDN92382.1 hypothetical protein SAMN05216360_112208 [Methylobacterium phyllostachyos]